jgi:hypothetical protein
VLAQGRHRGRVEGQQTPALGRLGSETWTS